jgi:CHAT domain-containing protein
MWWCPTGNFAHLPIHAAGADGSYCSHYVVSSYTPTLGALNNAKSSFIPVKKHEVRALVAAVPQSDIPQWGDLLSTSEEASVVKATLPKEALLSLSNSDEALVGYNEGLTAKELLENLPEATILHLACHGYQDPENALKSGFVMRDEMLTIERLMPVPLPRAFMAFLSACETAKGDKVGLKKGCYPLYGTKLRLHDAGSA